MFLVWRNCPQIDVTMHDTMEHTVIQNIQSPGPTPIDDDTGSRYTPTMLIDAAMDAALTKQHPMKMSHA